MQKKLSAAPPRHSSNNAGSSSNSSSSSSSSSSSRSCCCVECGNAVHSTYRDYGKGNIRLTICRNCNYTVDKYVEFQAVLIMIDLMLHKPQAYRHILYNRQPSLQKQQVLKMFIILVLLDMNMKAYLAERDEGGVYFSEDSIYKTTKFSPFRISQLSLHFLLLAWLENMVYMLTLLACIRFDIFSCGWKSSLKAGVTKFLGAMCISSFGKFFIMLTVIWEYNWSVIHVIGAIVVSSNYLALKLFVNDDSIQVLFAVALAVGVRALTQIVLYALGNPMIFYTLI